MDTKAQWEKVYSAKAPDQLSWFRPHLKTSLALIERAASERSASIIDVGGGASTLVDDLIAKGYGDLTVLDISQTAMDRAKGRLGETAAGIRWLRADVTKDQLPAHSWDVWHDRAVFHFLTEPAERHAYIQNMAGTVKPSGHVIVGAFGLTGPRSCSGFEVVRYNAESLQREFGGRFRLIESMEELHQTPFGTIQPFVYCHCMLAG